MWEENQIVQEVKCNAIELINQRIHVYDLTEPKMEKDLKCESNSPDLLRLFTKRKSSLQAFYQPGH